MPERRREHRLEEKVIGEEGAGGGNENVNNKMAEEGSKAKKLMPLSWFVIAAE